MPEKTRCGYDIASEVFVTKDEDPTGLLNEHFRYRDLETGTFITRDPLMFVDGPNLYAYVVQNPWTKFDPLGLSENDTGEVDKPKSPTFKMENGKMVQVDPESMKGSGFTPQTKEQQEGQHEFNKKKPAAPSGQSAREQSEKNTSDTSGEMTPDDIKRGGKMQEVLEFNSNEEFMAAVGTHLKDEAVSQASMGAIVYIAGTAYVVTKVGGKLIKRKAPSWPNLNKTSRPGGKRLKDPAFVKNNNASGEADFVVMKNGELRIGESHAYLSEGEDVLSAGRVRFNHGEVQRINNHSGHYQTHGVDASIPESAFNKAGYNASGTYKETMRPRR